MRLLGKFTLENNKCIQSKNDQFGYIQGALLKHNEMFPMPLYPDSSTSFINVKKVCHYGIFIFNYAGQTNVEHYIILEPLERWNIFFIIKKTASLCSKFAKKNANVSSVVSFQNLKLHQLLSHKVCLHLEFKIKVLEKHWSKICALYIPEILASCISFEIQNSFISDNIFIGGYMQE